MTLQRISHYRVDRLIGVGGMGEVYLAEDSTLQRKVALKILPERYTGDAERIRRFQREARAASALNHPNIITIYEVGEEEKRHYIATEFIEGRTLRDRINAQQPMTVAEVLDVAIGVASALCAAHEANILHRDIKPENIMMRPDGYVKVLDFGLAKLVDREVKESTTGTLMGTLLYISPEQARGQQPDARSDIYALGAVMYEMLTRQPPIATNSFVELAIAISSRDPDPPSSRAHGVPPELDRIVMKALHKNPDARYATARELLADLRTLRQELEFENKLSAVMTPDGRISSPALSLQQTALLSYPPETTSNIFGLGRASKRKLAIVVAAVIAAIVIGFVIWRYAAAPATIDSVAVLPFVNASRDPNSEYLSDGISDTIIDSLSQLPQVRVVARSTTFRYKDKNTDPVALGRELRVRGVVTGQLTQRGDTLIVRAELTDVKRGTQLWGRRYERKVADVLALQQEMAQAISDELRVKLSGEERKLLTRHSAVNPEAFQNYLKGRYYLSKVNEEAVRRAIVHFNRAIEIEPTYALAYAGIARSYYGLSNLFISPREAMPRAREAAKRALELDDSLAEAHAALALVLTWYDWDFKGGEREFRRAMELNPNDAEARRQYGDFLIVTGQFDRAIEEKKKAEELDPLSVPASWDVGRALFYAGRLEDANAQVKRTIELEENFPYTYLLQAQIACEQGRLDDSIAVIESAMARFGRTPLFVSTWGYLHARAGRRDKAALAIAELKASPNYTLPLFLARVSAGLGDNDDAMRWLQLLHEERSESSVWLKVDPTMATLRNDARFVELVKRVGL